MTIMHYLTGIYFLINVACRSDINMITMCAAFSMITFYKQIHKIVHYLSVLHTFWPSMAVKNKPNKSLLIYDLQSTHWINTYHMLKGFLKACSPPKVSNEMKCMDKKMTWKTQDTNLSSYVPKANVDHNVSGQGTGMSTLYHLATTPRVNIILKIVLQIYDYNYDCPCYFIINIENTTYTKTKKWEDPVQFPKL